MLLPIYELKNKYDMHVTGILHVGAHKAEERSAYSCFATEYISGLPTYWVEANRELADKLSSILAASMSQTVITAVVGETSGEEVVFNIANNGQSSSILELGTHKTAHPEVHYIHSETRYTETLEDIIMTYNIPKTVNFLNLDIQGAELMALKGLGDLIENFDYIYSEVNVKRLYEGCALMEEVDAFLTDYDKVECYIEKKFGWGDAFYIRKGIR